MVDSIVVVVGALTCVLLQLASDSKVARLSEQHSLIRELLLYKFKLGHDPVKATKNIFCAKGEIAVTRGFKKFQRSDKIMDSEAVLLAMKANLLSSTRRI